MVICSVFFVVFFCLFLGDQINFKENVDLFKYYTFRFGKKIYIYIYNAYLVASRSFLTVTWSPSGYVLVHTEHISDDLRTPRSPERTSATE